MSEYLLKIKGIVDQLASFGKPVEDDDIVIQVLRGLGPEYKYFTTSITTHSTPVTFSELRGMLINQEILDVETIPAHDISISTNLSTANNSSNNSPKRPTYNSRGRGHNRYRGSR